MVLSEGAAKIKRDLERYIASTPYALNPDESVLTAVLNGLAKREDKTGLRYCPCRLTTGNSEADRKIICPCEYHAQEVEETGMCHCQLLVKKE